MPYRDPELLAKRINADLAAVTPDKHLGVMYDPEQSRALAAAPPSAGADDAPPTPRTSRRGAAQPRADPAEVLPGNIRYLEIDGSSGPANRASAPMTTPCASSPAATR